MSRTSFYRTAGVCFCVFLLGIVVGGALILSVHRPNHIHLSVMPYQGVNLSPEAGDVIDWFTYGQTTPPTITFSKYTHSPCSNQNPGSICVYEEANNNIYIYKCGGSAICDPGVGPGSGTRGGAGNFYRSTVGLLASRLYSFDFAIDKGLGLIEGPVKPYGPTSGIPISPTPPSTPPTVVNVGNPDAEVGCISNQTSISNPSITKPVGQLISWVGSPSVSVAVDQSICKGDMSTAQPVQSCLVMKAAPATAYTITDAACTAQPTLSTPTITTTP